MGILNSIFGRDNRKNLSDTIDLINRLFSEKKTTLKDLSLDDLKREKILLEREERQLVQRIEDLERQKSQLFDQGRAEASVNKKRILASKIKECDLASNIAGKQLRYISKGLRTINMLVQIKENERLSQNSRLGEIIRNTNISDLQRHLDEIMVNGTLQFDKLEQVLTTLEGNEPFGSEDEDPDIAKIMEAFDTARIAELESPEDSAEVMKDTLERALGHDQEETENNV
jgi:hypothetical protein